MTLQLCRSNFAFCEDPTPYISVVKWAVAVCRQCLDLRGLCHQWCGAGLGGPLGNIPNPRAGPSFSFFVPIATYDDLVTSQEERHNTTPTGKTGKNTATMVAEPPSSPSDMELMDQRDRTCR